MISEKEIRALLNRIETSDSLGASSTYVRLLRFLVECSLTETVPKEQAIAKHLLGNNSAKSDTSKIRVYIYHLRKKLKQYFENEGKEEVYSLSIPKGSYKVQYKKNKRNTGLPILSLKDKQLLPPILLLLLCILIANAFFLYNKGDSNDKIFFKSIFWKEFFEDEKPIQIVIGDLLIFSEVDSLTGEVSNLRIPDINTLTQFEEYRNLKENEGRNLNHMTYTHLSKGSTEWVSSLTKIFHPEKEFNIRPCSRIEAKDLHDYNIVFVGMQKTAGLFNGYFDNSKFEYDLSLPNQYLLKQENEVLKLEPKGDPNGKHSDYGFIAKYPGPNDNAIFIFAGLWDSATSESLRNFVIDSKIKKVELYMKSQLGDIPQYFEMLIEVNGIDRIGFETKILHLNEISAFK